MSATPFRFTWERAVVLAGLGAKSASIPAVALALGAYANPDGSSVRPGEENLYVGLGLSRSTVSRALAELRDRGLIVKVRKGNSKLGQSDEYRLALPVGLPDKVAELKAKREAERASRTTHETSTDRVSLTTHPEADRVSGTGFHVSPGEDHVSATQVLCVSGDSPPSHDQSIHQAIDTKPTNAAAVVDVWADEPVDVWAEAERDNSDSLKVWAAEPPSFD